MSFKSLLLIGISALFLVSCAAGGTKNVSQTNGTGGLDEEPWKGVYQVALRMEETGDVRSAEKLYLQSLSKKADYEPAIEGLERVSLKTDDELLRLAIQGYRINLGKASKLQRRAYARNLLRAGFAEEASNQFRILTEMGGAGQDYSLYGLSLDHLGRHELARAAYEQALAKGHETAQLLNNKALSLALSGKYEEAAQVLMPLAGKSNPAVDLNLAAFLDLAGRTDEALKVLGGSQPQLDRTLKQFRSLKTAIETGRYADTNYPRLRIE